MTPISAGTYNSIPDTSVSPKIKSYFFIFLVLLVINRAFRKDFFPFSINFSFENIFFLFLVLMLGLLISPHFKAFLKTKLSLLLMALTVYGILLGFFHGAMLGQIIGETVEMSHLFIGALAFSLMSESTLRSKGIAIITYTFLSAIILLYFYFAFFSLTNFFYGSVRLGSMSATSLAQGLFCIYFVFKIDTLINNRRKRQATIIFLIMILLIVFISWNRTELVAAIAGYSMLLLGDFKRGKNSIMSLQPLSKIILVLLLTLGSYYFFSYIFTSFSIFNRGAGELRVEEFTVVLSQLLDSGSIYLGEGFGSWFSGTYSIPAERRFHIGVMTILLKFGILGLIFIFSSVLYAAYKYFFSSKNLHHKPRTSFHLAFPSIMAWLVFLSMAKGTMPETLFGLGFALAAFRQSPFNLKLTLSSAGTAVTKSIRLTRN